MRELVPTTGRVGHRSNKDQVLAANGWVLFHAGDAIWRARQDGRDVAPIAAVAKNADIVRFTVAGGQVYAGVVVHDPPREPRERPHHPLDAPRKQREQVRSQKSRPLVDAFFAWCGEQSARVEDGRLPLDNNIPERNLRREGVGRNAEDHGLDPDSSQPEAGTAPNRT
ncbi:hypothetical protein [Nannocystis exedens]|uniref:hypothetical protein n=1 Tax=Nannocystis exedens TaxID=54 RepID=UPI000BBA020C|nr:hypothetical protein [Nannocystis exedens]PCC68832.1 hypothetical protein NAEX_01852 [Nannocystis exedens]